jgi:NitT/TauT family transport system permease protein
MLLLQELLIATALSLARMFSAYIVSLLLAISVGSWMARSRAVESLLLPVLDVLQSIPILGFFPAALLLLARLLPGGLGLELAAVFLIVTSLVWNMIFGVYASLKALDPSVYDMAEVYRLGPAARFFFIYVPACRESIIANSLVSWAGGWFFLTSAEVLSLGEEEYRLRGIGSLILDSFSRGDLAGFYSGVAVLLAAILATYLLLWNPAAVTVLRLSLPGVPAVFEVVKSAVGYAWGGLAQVLTSLEVKLGVVFRLPRPIKAALLLLAAAAVAYSARGLSLEPLREAAPVLSSFPLELAKSLPRVGLVLLLSLGLSVMIAYFAHLSRGVSMAVSIAGEVLASIPAVVWWPLLSNLALSHPLGPSMVMLIVYLQGAFWYVYFNLIVYGLASLRKDLDELAAVYRVRGLPYLRYVFVPSLLPSLATGLLSAWGGSWNASIVAEYVDMGGRTFDMQGVGSLISKAAAQGNVAALLATSLALSLFIVLVNKTLWVRLFRFIERRYGGE